MQPEPALPSFVTDRHHALLARDWASLERLLEPGLRYVHATGIRHDKAEYLMFVREGIRVEAMRMEDAEASRLADVSLVTGRLRQTVLRRGETESVEVSSWVTEVWRLTDRWRLLVFQSTRVLP